MPQYESWQACYTSRSRPKNFDVAMATCSVSVSFLFSKILLCVFIFPILFYLPVYFICLFYFIFSVQNFVIFLLDVIGLQNFSMSFRQSLSRITMCNLHWCSPFCIGVTLTLHCSQPISVE